MNGPKLFQTGKLFQRNKPFQKEPAAFPHQGNRPGLAARLKPHELIAMLTHHYTRVRARRLPRVRTSLNVAMPDGRQAVIIGWGR